MEIRSFKDLNHNLISYVFSFSSRKDITQFREIKNKRLFTLIIKLSKSFHQIIGIKKANVLKTDEFTVHSFLYIEKYNKDVVYCSASSGHIYEFNLNTNLINPLTTDDTKHNGYAHCLNKLKLGSKYMIVSSSDDMIVKIWDLSNFSCVHSINISHITYLNKVIEYQKQTVLIIYTYSLFKLYLISEKDNDEGISSSHMFDLTGHENYIYCSLYVQKVNPDLIITGGYGRFLHFWSIEQKNSIKIVAHEDGIWALIYLKNYDRKMIASGSWDKTIKIWDIDSRCLISTHLAHSGMIYGLTNHNTIDNRFMVSSGYDKNMKIWKFNDSSLQFDLVHEEKCTNQVRICSIQEIKGELVLFVSVTKTEISMFKIIIK